MRSIHLLTFEGEISTYKELLNALERAKIRVGILFRKEPEVIPKDFSTLESLSVFKAAIVGDNINVSWKRRKGAPVLTHILDEYFRGCRVVFVKPVVDHRLPVLSKYKNGWLVSDADNKTFYSTAEFVARVRSPKPLHKKWIDLSQQL